MKNRMPIENNISNNEETEGSSTDLFELLGRLLRHKRTIFIITILVMALTTIGVMTQPNLYRSSCSILPSDKIDKLAELRQLTGMGGSFSSDENSSELYPVILRSQLIRDAILSHKYNFIHKGHDMTLTFSEYYESNNWDDLRKSLAGKTDISTDFQTGLTYISFESRYPGFSQAVLNKYLEELESFNHLKRRSSAGDNVLYLKKELLAGEEKLKVAEDNLESYQMVNRNYDMTSNPEIIKSITQLRREVEIKSRMYSFLMEQYEAARLDEQKDMPIIRLLDQPTLPMTKSSPKQTVTILLSGITTFTILTLVLLIIEHIRLRYRRSGEKSLENLSDNLASAFPRSTRALKLVHRVRTKERV